MGLDREGLICADKKPVLEFKKKLKLKKKKKETWT